MSLTRSILCPISLERTPVEGVPPVCQCCGVGLPPLYVAEPGGMTPLPVQFYGLSAHGKTSYLIALSLVLGRVNSVWDGFTATPATESSLRFVQQVNLCAANGTLPPATPIGGAAPYMMLLNRLPRWIKRALMVRDCSGQAFSGFQVDLEEASYLLKAPITLLFLSLSDLRDGLSAEALMNGYLNALVSNGCPVEQELRKIVLVLTKADRLLDRLPEKLVDYLTRDPIWEGARTDGEVQAWPLRSFDAYLKGMEDASIAIENWTSRQPALRTLATLARDRNIEIKFSLVSATGGSPAMPGNVLVAGWEPSRVVDPLLWALELESRRESALSQGR